MRAARHFTAGPRARMVLFFGDMLTCSHVSSARNIVGGQLFRVSGNYVTTSFFFFFLLFPSTCGRTLGCCYRCWQVLYREKFFPPPAEDFSEINKTKTVQRKRPCWQGKRHKFDVFAESFPWSVQQSSEQPFFPFENDIIFNICSTFIFYPEKILKGSCSSAAGGGSL